MFTKGEKWQPGLSTNALDFHQSQWDCLAHIQAQESEASDASNTVSRVKVVFKKKETVTYRVWTIGYHSSGREFGAEVENLKFESGETSLSSSATSSTTSLLVLVNHCSNAIEEKAHST
jgi:hypothetical protein